MRTTIDNAAAHKGYQQFLSDCRFVFSFEGITTACLIHLILNRHKWGSGVYVSPDGRKCPVAWLTAILPEHLRVVSKSDLKRFFGNATGREGDPGYIPPELSASYQPVKWIVRRVDGNIGDVWDRYGPYICGLSREELFDFIRDVAKQVLSERRSFEHSSADVSNKNKSVQEELVPEMAA